MYIYIHIYTHVDPSLIAQQFMHNSPVLHISLSKYICMCMYMYISLYVSARLIPRMFSLVTFAR